MEIEQTHPSEMSTFQILNDSTGLWRSRFGIFTRNWFKYMADSQVSSCASSFMPWSSGSTASPKRTASMQRLSHEPLLTSNLSSSQNIASLSLERTYTLMKMGKTTWIIRLLRRRRSAPLGISKAVTTSSTSTPVHNHPLHVDRTTTPHSYSQVGPEYCASITHHFGSPWWTTVWSPWRWTRKWRGRQGLCPRRIWLK